MNYFFDEYGWLRRQVSGSEYRRFLQVIKKHPDRIDTIPDANAGDSLYSTCIYLLTLPKGADATLKFISKQLKPMIAHGEYYRHPEHSKKYVSRDQIIPMLLLLKRENEVLYQAAKVDILSERYIPSKYGDRSAMGFITPDMRLFFKALDGSKVNEILYFTLDLVEKLLMIGWNGVIRKVAGFKPLTTIGAFRYKKTKFQDKASKLMYPAYALFLNCLMISQLPESRIKRFFTKIRRSILYPGLDVNYNLLSNSDKKACYGLTVFGGSHTNYKDGSKPLQIIDPIHPNAIDYGKAVKVYSTEL